MEQKYCALKQVLKDTKDQIDTNIKNTSSISDMVIELSGMSNKYSQIIKDFFSDADGEGVQIRQIYDKTSDFGSRYPKVTLPDINWVYHKYNEYLDGMKMFIDLKIQSIDNCNPDEESSNISEYIEKDSNFIESLFDDGVNSKALDPCEIKDALGNLEILIDFLPEMQSKTHFAEKIKASVNDDGEPSNPISQGLMRLYTLSTNHFSARLISSTFDSFQKIVDTMNQKQFSIPSTKHVERKTFQLF